MSVLHSETLLGSSETGSQLRYIQAQGLPTPHSPRSSFRTGVPERDGQKVSDFTVVNPPDGNVDVSKSKNPPF